MAFSPSSLSLLGGAQAAARSPPPRLARRTGVGMAPAGRHRTSLGAERGARRGGEEVGPPTTRERARYRKLPDVDHSVAQAATDRVLVRDGIPVRVRMPLASLGRRAPPWRFIFSASLMPAHHLKRRHRCRHA
eukprot:scaffold51944_cov110-Phaeocystis_antarctica.AAC.2